MSTLIESLKAEIARLEVKHGEEHPLVKDLKEQLRASEATSSKTVHEVYLMQAAEFGPPEAEKPETEEDGIRAEALRRCQVRQLFNAQPGTSRTSSLLPRAEIESLREQIKLDLEALKRLMGKQGKAPTAPGSPTSCLAGSFAEPVVQISVVNLNILAV